MSKNCVRHVTLEVNCGFARTAIRELTPLNKGPNKQIDTEQRQLKFRERFNECSNYGIEDSYFESKGNNGSLFNRDCQKILLAFKKKWNPTETRVEYLQSFSESKWNTMSQENKEKHTISSCKACGQLFNTVQRSFPQGPYYEEAVTSFNPDYLRVIGKKQGTRQALAEINIAFTNVFNTSFTQLVSQHSNELQKKPTQAEKRRKACRQFRDKENQHLKRAAAITVLTEDESQRSYNRKRKVHYFETPPAKRSKTKSHSPDYSKVTWDKDQVLNDLQQHPHAPPSINWQKFAREHNVPGKNAGQVVKEFARKSGIDTFTLDGQPANQARVCSSKRKLIGGEISVPSTPTVETINNEWKEMIESGELSLGVPCVPFKTNKFITRSGRVEKEEVTITGRKFPLLQLREEFLTEHEPYMRLNSDDDIDGLSHDALLSMAAQYSCELPLNSTTTEMCQMVKQHQRSRSLILWHDHGTILGLGCIFVTVHVAYDPAVFYTQQEYEEKHGKSPSIQSIVEQPKVHMMAAGSSSTEDQVALIQDRIDCLHDLPTKLQARNGVEVTDTLKFFVGDHPAQQFERGTQQGGRFKCGGCAVKNVTMGDLAHTFQHQWRSLQELQKLATAGKFGKMCDKSKPFDNLSVADLREELHSRNDYDTDKVLKRVLQERLDNILCGIQRVPTLLLLDPTQSLSDLNLQHYAVLDCEPLRDLKGHFSHIFDELPYLFSGDERKRCEEIIATNKGKTMTCAKCRVCMIQLFLYFRQHAVSKEIYLLLETAVRMSDLLYADDANRNPRNILRLYNCAWLHHELCNALFTTLHGSMTYYKLFGSYLHSLVAHAPQQMEIISLRSVNTENQERFFEQARRSADATSNRHPDNVLTTCALRLQAKSKFKRKIDAIQTGNSIVARAGKEIPKYNRTRISTEFTKIRQRSWQCHLQRIAHYIVPGKGVWWEKGENQYQFFDGDDDPISHPEGPQLRHHRSSTLKDIVEGGTKY